MVFRASHEFGEAELTVIVVVGRICVCVGAPLQTGAMEVLHLIRKAPIVHGSLNIECRLEQI